MTVEKIPTTEKISFPEKELKDWVEARYKDPDDKFAQELKKARLEAVRTKNLEGLKTITRVIFIQLSDLRGKFPEEWRVLNGLYQKLVKWLKSAAN